MANTERNHNQDAFELAGSAHPPDQQVSDREKQKPANQKQKLGGGKHGRVNQPLVGRAEEQMGAEGQMSRRADERKSR